jgi:hypothetical protein
MLRFSRKWKPSVKWRGMTYHPMSAARFRIFVGLDWNK